jgi:hypothetical protein
MNTTLKNYLKRQLWFRPIRLARLAYTARTNGHPDWTPILARDPDGWERSLRAAKHGPKVLIPTSVGGHFAVTPMESSLAVALTLRGADVHVLLCDAVLPACMACEVDWYPRLGVFLANGPSGDLCRSCFGPANRMFQAIGFHVHRYSEQLNQRDHKRAEELATETPLDAIRSLEVDAIAVGEHSLAGALRFCARGTLDGEPHGESLLRRYLHAGLLTTFATKQLLDRFDYTAAVFHHGIYVPQGIIGEVLRKRHIPIVNWHPAYRKKRFLFSHGDTYHKTLISEPTEAWEKLEWSPELEAETLRYLESRRTGKEDWIHFQKDPKFDLSEVERLGVDFSKPCIGLLTNVIWDAQLHYAANAFPNMLEWLFATVEYFRKRPDLQLLIRVHPAEIRGALPSRQRAIDELLEAIPDPPENVFCIPPESRVSTYTAMTSCDSVLIYGTKTGIELASLGIPVITAGEAFVRNKGLSIDANSADEYFALLDRLPLGQRMDGATTERARKYAFHFFFRRMIPLDFMEPIAGFPPYRIALEALELLKPGVSPGLDIICDGILKGTEFVYPAESIRTRQVCSAV